MNPAVKISEPTFQPGLILLPRDAVHTGGGTMPGDPTTIAQSDLINLVNTGQIGSLTIGAGMGNMQQNIQNYNVQVFAVDPVALSQTPPVVQPLANSQWSGAAFGQPIAIVISGTYNPVLPSLLFMNSSIPFQVTVMCASEAN